MPETFVVRLNWPAPELSPNARVDRRSVSRARKSARLEVLSVAKRLAAKVSPNAHITLTFHPPDQRRRDLGNLLASMRSQLDGIAEACGIDNCEWTFTILRGVSVDRGCVVAYATNGGYKAS